MPAFADAPSTNGTMVSDLSVHSFIEEKAIEAFPEYESKILGEYATPSRTRSSIPASGEIVVQETRALSDKEYVQYTELSNGVVYYALLGMSFAGMQQTDLWIESGYTLVTMNAWMNCSNSSDSLIVSDIVIRINNNGTNSFDSFGRIDGSTSDGNRIGDYKTSGTSASPAYVNYIADFTMIVSTGFPTYIEQTCILTITANQTVSSTP